MNGADAAPNRPRRERTGGRLRAVAAATAAFLAAAAVATGSPPARAATYKWVDEKGVVHYSDKMPPEAVDKASVELNKEGVPVRRNEPAPSAEQLRAKAQEEERQRQLARQNEEVARRDRALVASYTSEAEIDLARKRALQTIDSVIQSSQAFVEQLNKRKAEAEAKRSQAKTQPVVAAADRELEGIDAELARQDELIAQKRKEAAAVTAKYDADKQRWRELVAAKSVSDPASTASAAAKSPAGTSGAVKK